MTTPPMKDLKTWRKQHGLSQKKLAELAKVSLETLRKVEALKGKPRADTLKKIEQAIMAAVKTFEGAAVE